MAAEVPTATARSNGLYGEPRYPASRSSEKKPRSTNASASGVVRPSRTEVCISVIISRFYPPLDDTQFQYDMS